MDKELYNSHCIYHQFVDTIAYGILEKQKQIHNVHPQLMSEDSMYTFNDLISGTYSIEMLCRIDNVTSSLLFNVMRDADVSNYYKGGGNVKA